MTIKYLNKDWYILKSTNPTQSNPTQSKPTQKIFYKLATDWDLDERNGFISHFLYRIIQNSQIYVEKYLWESLTSHQRSGNSLSDKQFFKTSVKNVNPMNLIVSFSHKRKKFIHQGYSSSILFCRCKSIWVNALGRKDLNLKQKLVPEVNQNPPVEKAAHKIIM